MTKNKLPQELHGQYDMMASFRNQILVGFFAIVVFSITFQITENRAWKKQIEKEVQEGKAIDQKHDTEIGWLETFAGENIENHGGHNPYVRGGILKD